MGSSHQQTVDEVPEETYSSAFKGKVNASSDKETRVASFPATPAFNGYDPKATFTELVMDDSVKDPEGKDAPGLSHYGFTSDYSRGYDDAPEYKEVTTGAQGLPGTAHQPNLASPEGGTEPSNINKRVVIDKGAGPGTTLSPKVTSKAIRNGTAQGIENLADGLSSSVSDVVGASSGPGIPKF